MTPGALAEVGFAVGLVARTEADLEETRRLVLERGATAVSAAADVTDARALHHAVIAIEQQAGDRITVLVNNAGSLRAIGPLWEVDPEDWWLDVRTSLGGAFVCCREVVPRMIRLGEGRIVNLTSYVAVRPTPYQTGYAAGKAGIVSLTEALAASLEGSGVKAFSVAPGFTPDVGKGRSVEAESSARLIAWLASGAGDELNGRLIHPLDDPQELLRRIDEIRRDELYAPRLRRLPAETKL